jgi:hypothetical protein
MLIPRTSDQQQHDNDNKTLFGRRENKDRKEPFHLLA